MVAIAACTDRFCRAVIETGIPVLEIVIDSHEQYPYRFTHQQVSTIKRVLPCGDYGVRIDGSRVASVERKSLVDLVASLIGGTLRYALAELAALPRAAVVVEDRYSGIFKLDRVRPAMIADGLAELQVRWPNVPIVFCETRPWPRNGPTATSRPPTFGPHRGRRDHPPHPTGTSTERAVHRCGPRVGARRRSHRPRSRSAPTRHLGRLARKPPGVATALGAGFRRTHSAGELTISRPRTAAAAGKVPHTRVSAN